MKRPLLTALAVLILALVSPALVLSQDPTGAPGDPPDPPAGSDTTRTTSVSVAGKSEGAKYVITISATWRDPGTPGEPEKEDDESDPTRRPGPPPGDTALPRTTYYINRIQLDEGFTSYCVLHEEERRAGQPWPYWYELCTRNPTVVQDPAKHRRERLHSLRTNIPLFMEITPGGELGVVPYSDWVWVPQRHGIRDIELRGDPISARDPREAADSVLANLPMPNIALRANPRLGLVNLPSWWWVEGYDGSRFGREESVFLSTGSETTPTGDCPPLLRVRDMRTNHSMSAGTAEIIKAVLGGRPLPVLWGWGYSDMPGHPAYLGYAHFHTGMDLLMPVGTPLHAPAAGTVTTDTWRDGNSVVSLRLASGHVYRFLHLSRFGKTGPVKAGDVIGYSGDTGYSGDPHLHVEMLPPGVSAGEYVPPEHWACLGGAPGATVTVAVTVRPTGRYAWDFGDGTVRLGSLGRKYPRESDVSHTYRHSSLGHPDGFPTQLTVTFSGEYTVDGGPPQPLPPIEMTYEGEYEVQEAQSVLTGGRGP